MTALNTGGEGLRDIIEQMRHAEVMARQCAMVAFDSRAAEAHNAYADRMREWTDKLREAAASLPSGAQRERIERDYGRRLMDELIPHSVQCRVAGDGDDLPELLMKLVQVVEFLPSGAQEEQGERDCLCGKCNGDGFDMYTCTNPSTAGGSAPTQEAEELTRLRQRILLLEVRKDNVNTQRAWNNGFIAGKEQAEAERDALTAQLMTVGHDLDQAMETARTPTVALDALKAENKRMRKVLQLLFVTLQYNPKTRTYAVSETGWFAQPYTSASLPDSIMAALGTSKDGDPTG